MRVRNILIFRHECCKHSMIWAPTQYSVYYRNRQIEENRPKSTFKRTLDACCHHMKNIMSSKKRDVTALFMTSCHYDEYTVIHDIFIPASWSHPLSQLSLHHNYLCHLAPISNILNGLNTWSFLLSLKRLKKVSLAMV